MQKNIYAISPEEDYLKTVASFMFQKSRGNLLELAKFKLILPNRRSVLKIKEDFINISPNKSIILPQIFSLSSLDEEELQISNLIDKNAKFSNLPAVNYEKKLALIAKIIRDNSEKNAVLNNISYQASLRLSASLISLIDDITRYELSIDDLDKIIPDEISHHKQISVNFIKYITEEYPKILLSEGYIDSAKRTSLLIDLYAENLAKNNDKSFIFIAGSKGSIPATKRLIKIISKLENGAVILPYMDDNLNSFEWDNLADEQANVNHQKPLFNLLKFLEIKSQEVKYITNDVKTQKSKIISSLMKQPSQMTEWKNIKTDLNWIKLIEAKNLNHEAKIISTIIYHKISQNKSVALVTNNQDLAQYVELFIKKFGIDIDNSSGHTIYKTNEGLALIQVARLISSNYKIIDLLAVLKIFNLENITDFELMIRKHNIKNIYELFNKSENLRINEHIKSVLKDISEIINESDASFISFVYSSYKIINLLDKTNALQNNDIWQKIKLLIGNFVENESGQIVNQEDFASCIQLILSNTKIWPKYVPNRSYTILSPIEARLQKFDCIILGDLQLGSWPVEKFSPWISNNMFKTLEIPFEEEAIALSAHDFAFHLHADEVFLTYSKYNSDKVAVESPFISRVKAFNKAVNGNDIEFDNIYSNYVSKLEGDYEATKTYKTVMPKPPIEARLNRISVTKIETLIKNPYAVYASEILNLKKLEDLDAEAEAKDYGNFIHKVLENFTNYHKLEDSKITKENFLYITEEIYKNMSDKNLVNPAWLVQIEKIADWFVSLEKSSSQNLKNIYPEIKAELEIEVKGKKFILVCKADRIEVGNDNIVNIIDYKTGFFPNQTQVKRLISPQLLLEALMLKKGAFQQIGHENNLGNIIYYNLSYANNGPERKIYELELEKLTELTENELKNLIEDLQDPEVPFLIRPNPKLKPEYDDYEHLERIDTI